MPDEREQLQATLNELRAQLDRAALDPEVAERLRLAAADIDAALAGQQPKRTAAQSSSGSRNTRTRFGGWAWPLVAGEKP